MGRFLGLKRKVPLLSEENTRELNCNPTNVFSKLKRQSFRPPFATLKENVAECVKPEDHNSLPNDTTESKQNASINAYSKFTKNVREANDGVLPIPITKKQGKENLGTDLGTLNQNRKPLLSQRHENILKSDIKGSPGGSLGIRSRNSFNSGFSNTEFKFPGQLCSTDMNDSLLSASKLNLPAPNPESANQNASVSASTFDKEKSTKPLDSESVKTYESAMGKTFISRDLLKPSKNSYIKCQEKTENSADAKQAQSYSVLYAKRMKNSKPKGPWSDGVLLVCDRQFTLQNIDGKAVTKVDCQGFRNMSEGVILEIGKFHVEVVRESLHDEYNTWALSMRNKSPSSHCVESIQRNNKRPSFQHSQIKAERDKALSAPFKALHKDAFILNTKHVQDGGAPIYIDPYLNTKLRPHQREGVKFLFECVTGLRVQAFTGCLLADEMGLGKTLQVITLIWTLFQQVSKVKLEFKRALVVCPMSLVQNWGNEVRKWLGVERLRTLVVHGGSSAAEAKQQFTDFKTGNVNPLLITSYELFRKYSDIIGSSKPGLLVCDEAHRLKNCVGNKTIDALLALKCPRRILLTGTPVQNNLNEFYAMMEFANQNLLGPLSAFKRLYTEPIERSRDRNASIEEKGIGQARSLDLQTRTQFCILRRSASINKKYLPSKTEYILFCRPQPSQISLYLEVLKSKAVTNVIQSANASSSILQVICLLRKLCNHPKLVDNTFFQVMGSMHASCIVESSADTIGKGGYQKQKLQYRFEPGDSGLSGKLQCLDSLLSSVFQLSSNTNDRVVIVSNFTRTLDIVQGLCDHRCWKWLRLDGTTNPISRQQLVDHFNKALGDELVFLLSSKAGGTGLNLIGANRLVLFDPDWNPAIDAQAMARIWRDGQPKPVTIYRLLTTGSIEEKIYQRQVMKGEVAATIGGYTNTGATRKKGGQHFSRDELRELFSFRLDTLCDTYDLLSRSKFPILEDWKDCSKNVEDISLKRAIQDGIITFVHQITENAKSDVD